MPNQPLTYKEAAELVRGERLEREAHVERAVADLRSELGADINGLGQRVSAHAEETEQRFTRNEERQLTRADQLKTLILGALISGLIALALGAIKTDTKTVIQPQPTVTATVTASPAPLSYPTPVTTVTVRPVVARAARPGASPSPTPRAPRPTPSPTPTPTPPRPAQVVLQRVCHLLKDPPPLCKGKPAARHLPLLPFIALVVPKGRRWLGRR